MLRRMALIVAAGLILPLGSLLSDDTPDKELPNSSDSQENLDRWMQIKLKSSQEVLAGLTRGDFDHVEKSARRMMVLNVLEQWSRRRGEYVGRSDYEGQLNAFDFATKELIREAKQKDVEGTLEAYVALSRSCVRCHQLVRDAQPVP